MGRNNTTSRLYFSIANGTSSTQASCVLPTDQSLNTWYHVACVYNNTEKNIKIYLNGDLAVTYNTTIVPNLASVTSIGIGGSPLASYGLKGKLNDVRIYDHALSALEVKEISQALILHYKLDGFSGSVGENLLIGSKLNLPLQGPSTQYSVRYNRYYNGNASNHTFTPIGKDTYEDTILLNSASNLGIAFERLASEINLDPSSYYTLSC